MATMRLVRGELHGVVGAGFALGEPIGAAIVPLFVGLICRPTGELGGWRWDAVADDDDVGGCHDRVKAVAGRADETGEAMAVAGVNRVLSADEGRWYCYGYIDDVAVRGSLAVDSPRVGGRLCGPLLRGLREAVEQWVSRRYDRELTALLNVRNPGGLPPAPMSPADDTDGYVPPPSA